MPVTITHSTPADGTFSATGAAAWDATHTVSGLGTMAEQNSNNVNITGGSITGVTGVLSSLTVNSTPTSGGAAGQIMFDTGSVLQESSNLVWDNTNKKLTITGATVTTSQPVLDMTQTWNNASTVFTGIKLNVTNTASNANSLLMDLQIGGVSKFQMLGPDSAASGVSFSVRSSNNSAGAGLQVINTSGTSNSWSFSATGSLNTLSYSFLFYDLISNYSFLRLTQGSPKRAIFNGTVSIAWDNGSSQYGSTTIDLILRRRGAANLQLGAADAAAPVAQTLSVQSVVAGTSNTAGANLTITGSQGTGTGAGGDIIFQTALAGSSGTAQNTLTTALRIYSNQTVAVGKAYAVATLPAAGTQGRRAWVTDATAPTFLGALTGGGAVVCPVFDNGTAWVAG